MIYDIYLMIRIKQIRFILFIMILKIVSHRILRKDPVDKDLVKHFLHITIISNLIKVTMTWFLHAKTKIGIDKQYLVNFTQYLVYFYHFIF